MNLITKEEPKAVVTDSAQNDSFSNIPELQGAKDQEGDIEPNRGQKNHSFMEYGDEVEAIGKKTAKATPPEANSTTKDENTNYLNEPEGDALDEQDYAVSYKSYEEEDIKDLERTLGHLKEP